MAKGNDGNLLQHTIEVEVGAALLDMNPEGGMYLVSTHAMAPFEPLDAATKDRAGTKLASKLRMASSLPESSLGSYPWIVRALSGVGASPSSYPNSATLLDWLCAQRGVALDGTLVDVDEEKVAALRARFTTMRAIEGSWRVNLEALHSPGDKNWIFSMDPMQFVSGSAADNDRMTEADMDLLQPVLSSYFSTGAPGVFVLFSYSMRKDQRVHLAEVVSRWIEAHEALHLGVLETLNYTSDYHMAMLITPTPELLPRIREATLSVLGGHARDHDDFEIPRNVFE